MISITGEEYFEDLLNFLWCEGEVEENRENLRQVEVEDIGENECLITEGELKAAVGKMKNGKAPGDDEIPEEIIKKIGPTGLKWMLDLMNLAWQGKQVPENCAGAVICPIHKNVDKTNCENYRGISLLSHIRKIYERILEKKLEKYSWIQNKRITKCF